jgi:hypothetical protein
LKPGKPYLDRIIYKIVPTPMRPEPARDRRHRHAPAPVNEHVDVVKKLPNGPVSTPSIVPWLLWINQTALPFNDKKVAGASHI